MKAGVIIFHKNVFDIYKPEWIEKCINSLKNQTYKDFVVFEMDYGGNGNVVWDGADYYISTSLNNHALAHNHLADIAFMAGCDCVFNVNVDDYYALNRFEKQLPYIEHGYDVVSSNFIRVDESERPIGRLLFDGKDIVKEASRGHNVIAHPVCCYSKNFWFNCDKLNPKDIPQDDFILWKKSYEKGFKFIILPDILLYQRIHSGNVSKKK